MKGGFPRSSPSRYSRIDHETGGFVDDEGAEGRCEMKTWWRSMEDFLVWTRSEAFAQAHANRPPKEMFRGPSKLDCMRSPFPRTRSSVVRHPQNRPTGSLLGRLGRFSSDDPASDSSRSSGDPTAGRESQARKSRYCRPRRGKRPKTQLRRPDSRKYLATGGLRAVGCRTRIRVEGGYRSRTAKKRSAAAKNRTCKLA